MPCTPTSFMAETFLVSTQVETLQLCQPSEEGEIALFEPIVADVELDNPLKIGSHPSDIFLEEPVTCIIQALLKSTTFHCSAPSCLISSSPSLR